LCLRGPHSASKITNSTSNEKSMGRLSTLRSNTPLKRTSYTLSSINHGVKPYSTDLETRKFEEVRAESLEQSALL
jgi:hypothetical protein